MDKSAMTRSPLPCALLWLALFAWLMLFTAGCDDRRNRTNRSPVTVSYVHDARTGICFAVLRQGDFLGATFGIVTVPCTPQVLAFALPVQPEAPVK